MSRRAPGRVTPQSLTEAGEFQFLSDDLKLFVLFSLYISYLRVVISERLNGPIADLVVAFYSLMPISNFNCLHHLLYLIFIYPFTLVHVDDDTRICLISGKSSSTTALIEQVPVSFVRSFAHYILIVRFNRMSRSAKPCVPLLLATSRRKTLSGP